MPASLRVMEQPRPLLHVIELETLEGDAVVMEPELSAPKAMVVVLKLQVTLEVTLALTLIVVANILCKNKTETTIRIAAAAITL